jgi:hypothetical protein
MAEAPEHQAPPRGPEPATEPPERAEPVGPLLGLPAAESAEPYRPLSLLAVGGFVLAVVYAAAVTLGGLAIFAGRYPRTLKLLLVLAPASALLVAAMRGVREPARLASHVGLAAAATAVVLGLASLVAFSSTNPWLLPDGMWAVVFLAAVISWAARLRIQASEGTLSGMALARWGLGLSLFFGVNYAAYLASNIIAVRDQARRTADDFLAQLQKGDLYQAFLRTLPPKARPEGGNVRDFIERVYNTPQGRSETGPFTRFCESELVRMVQMGGEESRIEPAGATEQFEKGAYRVVCGYKISTGLGTFEVAVPSAETPGPGGRREWYVDLPGIQLARTLALTPEGEDLGRVGMASMAFGRDWAAKIQRGQLDDAYLDTVPPARRGAQRAARALSSGVAGLGGQAHLLGTPAGRGYHDGREEFRKASLLDAKKFWADSQFEKPMLETMRKVFAGTVPVPFSCEPGRTRLPLTRVTGKRVEVALPCRFLFSKPTGEPDFLVEAEILVEAPLNQTPPPPSTMQVRSLRLVRGQSAPPMQQRPR